MISELFTHPKNKCQHIIPFNKFEDVQSQTDWKNIMYMGDP